MPMYRVGWVILNPKIKNIRKISNLISIGYLIKMGKKSHNQFLHLSYLKVMKKIGSNELFILTHFILVRFKMYFLDRENYANKELFIPNIF